MVSKKKLYAFHPNRTSEPIESFQTRDKRRLELSDPRSLERNVRQLFANKISGTMVGLWLLVPEHLRLGTWDLVCRYSGETSDRVDPRLTLQLVHEAALCVTGIRQARTLSQKGFEVLNGLPFVASDSAIHSFLIDKTIEDSQRLQVELGLIRRARGHFKGRLLALDPHRLKSFSKRQMCRKTDIQKTKPYKVAQTFFLLDAETEQPVCFTLASSAMSVTKATPPLLNLSNLILNSRHKETLVMADTEHYASELIEYVHSKSPYDILLPVPKKKVFDRWVTSLPQHAFTRHWAGYATAKIPYTMYHAHIDEPDTHWMFIQRCAEREQDFYYKMFYCTGDHPLLKALTEDYPKRWTIEEFFRINQDIGWRKGRTLNLNIRYGQMTCALIAQAAIHQLRQRLGKPYNTWDARHLADDIFRGIDGDIRVKDDTLVVTFYNAPNSELLSQQYENLPQKLIAEGVDPRIPWLFNFKLDFRFK